MQKGFGAIYLFVIAVILALGVAVYSGKLPLGLQKGQPTPTPTPEVNQVDETSDREIYTSFRAGLSFSYPLGCETPKEGVGVISLSCYADKDIDRTLGSVVTDNDLIVTINYEENTNNESLDGYVARMKETYQTLIDLRDLLIGGQPAKAWRSEGQLVNNEFYHVVYRGKNFDVVKNPLNTTRQREFDKILSTFKFLDSGQKNEGSADGKFCGGIAANLPENQCPTGYKCQLDGDYPDASGKCVKSI